MRADDEKNYIYVSVIDRSTVDEVSMYDPKAKKSWTTREQVDADVLGKRFFFRRTDIGLVNIGYADGTGESRCVYATASGKPNYCGNAKYFTLPQRTELLAINQRIVALVKEWPNGEFLFKCM